MKDYLIHLTSHYTNGRSEYAKTINGDSPTEALQLFMQDFDYNDLSENNLVDDTLSISITVKQQK